MLPTFLSKRRGVHCNPVQGQYRARTGLSLCSKFSQGKTCFHYREPLFSLQGSFIHYRDFPVRITTQGDPCSHYREWVCSAVISMYGLHLIAAPIQRNNCKANLQFFYCNFYIGLYMVNKCKLFSEIAVESGRQFKTVCMCLQCKSASSEII